MPHSLETATDKEARDMTANLEDIIGFQEEVIE
jgi:hypothetical protein